MTTDESVEAPVPGLLRARVTSPMLEIACTASAAVATTRLGIRSPRTSDATPHVAEVLATRDGRWDNAPQNRRQPTLTRLRKGGGRTVAAHSLIG